jgi:glycerophosphoryl diester phosphodiesterase
MSYEEVDNLPKDKRHYIKDMTLDQLRNYNFGHFFKDKYNNNNMPYHNLTSLDNENNLQILKDNDLQIVEASEFFNEFYNDHKDLLFILEIKDEGERGKLASDKLITMLKDSYPEYLDNLVIGTFHPEIEEYLSTNYKDIYKGASTSGAAGFIISEYLKVNLFYTPGYSCLQIPMSYKIKGIEIPLDSKDIIKKAHQRSMAVQYWTINDKDEMHRVIDLNCDAIMTDDLKLIYEVYNEYK